MRLRPDPFTLILLAAILAASLWPAEGTVAAWLGRLGTLAVAVLFFIRGAALSRDQIRAGATHWRLHLFIAALTFLLFPLLVLPIDGLAPRWIPEDLALGFLYLGVLPSAVSSSIAFTAMARGNVPAAICSAAMNSGSLAFAVTASSARRAAPTELSRCSVAAACSTACRDGGDASCGTAVSCSVARCDSCHDSVGASRRFSRSFVGLRRIGGGGGTSSFRQSAKQRSQPSGPFLAPASCGTGGGARTLGAICATVRGVKRGARLLPARQLRVVGTPVTPVEDIFFGRLRDGRRRGDSLLDLGQRAAG